MRRCAFRGLIYPLAIVTILIAGVTNWALKAWAWLVFTPCVAYIESVNYTTGEDSVATGDFGDSARITGYETDADNLVSMATINGSCNCGQATQALDDAVLDSFRLDLWWDVNQNDEADAGDAGNGGWITICTVDPNGNPAHHTVGLSGSEGNLLQYCSAYNLHLGRFQYLARIYACNIYGFCNATITTVFIPQNGTGDWADNEIVGFYLNVQPEPGIWR